MAETKPNLNSWLEQVKKAKSTSQMWKVLDEFRKFEWTSEERAEVFYTYMKVLPSIAKSTDTTSATKSTNETPANDGPVWYEKM